MMQGAKIQFSAQEMELLTQADWILTKNTIVNKVMEALGTLVAPYRQVLESSGKHLPDTVLHTVPKISKGEQYRGLPYLVLDYPRFFSGKNIFAIRTMFWFGHFFSITLHLGGDYAALFRPALMKQRELLAAGHWYTCHGATQWEHHFEPDNYVPVAGLTQEEWEQLLQDRPFLKLAHRIALTETDRFQQLPALFREIIGVLAT
jgi:hypothetical protein